MGVSSFEPHPLFLCCRDSIKSVFLQALVLCLSQSLIFYLYSAGFSLGAFLVIQGRAQYEDIFQSVPDYCDMLVIGRK